MGILKLFFRLQSTHPKFVRHFEKRHFPSGYVYVVGSGYQWNPKSVLVNICGKKYMFNCGPGMSRLLNEHKGITEGLQAVFITKPSWENIGGFRGMLLGFNEYISKELVIYGFPYEKQLLLCGKHLPKNIATKFRDGKGYYVDKHLQINQVTLKPMSQHENCERLPRNISHLDNSKSLSEDVLSYILRSHNKGRILNYEKILERGIPGSHPVLADLLAGKDVTLPSGETVRSDDVTETEGSETIIVIECPSEEYLPSVEKSRVLQECQSSSKIAETIIVHFTPSAVMRSSRYINWMRKFSSSTVHLFVNDGNLVDGLVTPHYRQRLLNKLHPGIFPQLKDRSFYWLPAGTKNTDRIYCKTKPYVEGKLVNLDSNKTHDSISTNGSKEWLNRWENMEGLNIYEGRPGTRVQLRPCAVTRNSELVFDEFCHVQMSESMLPEKILVQLHDKLEKAGIASRKPSKLLKEVEKTYPRIVFLGTGWKSASKLRNLPSILLRLEGDTSMLLDCGEGTHAQIHRLFGDQASKIFRSINAVFISHLNGEQELGLLDIIREREKAFSKDKVRPLLLLATSNILPWLTEMKVFCKPTPKFIFIPLEDLLTNDRVSSKSMKAMDYIYSRTGLIQIQTTRSRFFRKSFGVSLEHADGWRVLYSGDPPFHKDLCAIGLGHDLLISGGTYERIIQHIPLESPYSMLHLVLKTARSVKAKFTIMTNFSQQYCSGPNEDMLKRSDVSFASDLMQVTLENSHHLPLFHEVFDYFNKSIFTQRANLQKQRSD